MVKRLLFEWVKNIDSFALDSLESLVFFDFLYKEFVEGVKSYSTKFHTVHNIPQMFENGTRDENLFHTANCLVKGGMPKEEIFQVLQTVCVDMMREMEKQLDRSGREIKAKGWVKGKKDWKKTIINWLKREQQKAVL